MKTTYREDLYTSVLDVSKMTPEQIEHATRIAKEIEGNTQADSLHALEERGIAVDAGLTEEAATQALNLFREAVANPGDPNRDPRAAIARVAPAGHQLPD